MFTIGFSLILMAILLDRYLLERNMWAPYSWIPALSGLAGQALVLGSILLFTWRVLP